MPRREITSAVVMAARVIRIGVDLDFERLDRDQLGQWIRDLRKAEAAVRRLRKRLEALQAGIRPGPCRACGQPFSGRPDAVYCGTTCRVRAHRARNSTVISP